MSHQLSQHSCLKSASLNKQQVLIGKVHDANKVKGFVDYDNVFRAGTAVSIYLCVDVTLLYKGGRQIYGYE